MLCVIQRHLPKPFTGGEEITRNHRCRMIEELIDPVFERLEHGVPFDAERNVYIKRPTVRVDHLPYGGELFSCVTRGLTYDGGAGGDTREHPGI